MILVAFVVKIKLVSYMATNQKLPHHCRMTGLNVLWVVGWSFVFVDS